MKTIFVYLTTLVVTANAFAIFGFPDDQPPQSQPKVQSAPQRVSPVFIPPNAVIVKGAPSDVQRLAPSSHEAVDLTDLDAGEKRELEVKNTLAYYARNTLVRNFDPDVETANR